MKKLVSVFVLLMFVGSLIVMTGCFGGSDGIGAILGAAVFVLAITASGGSGAAVFAANQNPSLRPAINIGADAAYIRVWPLKEDGTDATTTPYVINNADLTKDIANNRVTHQLRIEDNYNQYRIEFYASGTLLTQAIKYVPTALKTGNAANLPILVNATSTAEVLVYNKWQTTAQRRNYSDFSYNLRKTGTVNIDGIAGSINTSLQAWTTDKSTAPNYAGAEAMATTEAAKIATVHKVQTISGYVYRKDGTAMNDVSVSLLASGTNALFTADYPQGASFITDSNGYFVFENIPDSFSYRLYPPSVIDHSFSPTMYDIILAGADQASKNFRAIDYVDPHHPGNSK